MNSGTYYIFYIMKTFYPWKKFTKGRRYASRLFLLYDF